MSGPSTDAEPATGVGPAERDIERAPTDPSSARLWTLALAGPVLWITHFVVVYLFAEAACVAVDEPGGMTLGEDSIAGVVLLATAVAAVAIACTTAWAARLVRSSGGPIGTNPGTFSRVGVLTGVCSFVAVLAVGTPALVLGPC